MSGSPTSAPAASHSWEAKEYHFPNPQTDTTEFDARLEDMEKLRKKESVVFEACAQLEEVIPLIVGKANHVAF